MAVRARIGIEDVHRLSLDNYHRLIQTGALDEDTRVELIDGLVVDTSPKTREHEAAIRWLTRWLVRAVDDDRYEVGVGNPLTLTASEPEPDLIVFEHGVAQPYHPATATLVIEVAISSLARDLGVKAPLYAAAGVAEYWVLDVEGGRMVVHRQPHGDAYAERFERRAGEELHAAALPLPTLDVGELLAALG